VSPAMLGFPDIQLIGFAQMLLGVKKKDFLHRWIYKRLNKLCVLTHWQKKALLPYLPVHEDLYCTVPNFVDCNKFNPNRRSEAFRYQLGIREDQFAIGAVGRLDRQKGQLELVKAFHKVSQKYVNCKLVLVGEATQGEEAQMAYAKDIHKLVEDLNLQTRVIFTGFRKDVYKIYANLDLFVLPSYRETFGFVVVEAMASGVPVLGTNAGGVTEILGSGNYGYLCEPQDVDSMADKLEHILSNQKDREFTAQAALTHVRNTYEKSKVYQSLMKHIQ
ncbi:MAG: glycosyltransferase family 4 protein, partial [Bdellovibrionales bacterium]|nr:glycosyltransferase family 4 protein [Bdellovibrionales bacterium]